MAAVANRDKRLSIATIFISAHSTEMKEPLVPDLEVRIVNSQAVPGKGNFESPESIQHKLIYWTNAFKTRGDKTTLQVLNDGIETINQKLIEELTPTIATNMKPIRLHKDKDGNIIEKEQTTIIKMMKEILESGESLDVFFESIPKLNVKNINKFKKIIIEDNPFDKLSQFNVSDEYLNEIINIWISSQINKFDEQTTNKARLDHVLSEKLYVLAPNHGEELHEVLPSVYGIHLIQDSKNEDGINLYDKFANYSNLLMNLQIQVTDDQGNVIYNIEENVEKEKPDSKSALSAIASFFFSPSVSIKTKANQYFGPKLGFSDEEQRPFQNTIYLSEIIAFFKDQGYDILNIIDTGCRNFNPFDIEKIKGGTRFYDELSHVEKQRKLIEKANKKLVRNQFSNLGKKRHKKHKTRRTNKKNQSRKYDKK